MPGGFRNGCGRCCGIGALIPIVHAFAAGDLKRRAAIVAYEAETNIIIHSLGGTITVAIEPDRLIVDAVDTGPGIEHVELAMREGWSTAGGLARELGFGAGMGLPNMKKCSDRFTVESSDGRPTHVHAEIFLQKAGGPT